MTLKKLLSGIKILETNVDLKIRVKNIISDHRKNTDKPVFVALRGTKRNGNDFINEAIEKGAIAVVTDMREYCKEKIPYVLVENARSAIAVMWSKFYKNPSKGIKTVAITGTNGKTSSAYYLYNILRCANISCGLISTIECLVNGEKINIESGGGSVLDIDSAMTTPDPEILYLIYNKMKENGVEIVVMEASSHALEQNRLDGMEIEIGAFTNLSSEHLDYHKTMEEYFLSKEKLMEKAKICIVNADDEYGKKIMEKYREKAKSYAVTESGEFEAKDLSINKKGVSYKLTYLDCNMEIRTPQIGLFSVYNSLLAAACATVLGVEKKHIVEGIKNTHFVKGRLEKYKNKSIYIDYAHTPVAMENVIKAIKEIEATKRLVVLFGCGGDRDKEKRAKMGEISTSWADFTIITTDNPRTEKPNTIIADILKGISDSERYMVIPNRKEAIKYVAKSLTEQDVFLLLGKGHEEYEINGLGKVKFDEREILDEVFK